MDIFPQVGTTGTWELLAPYQNDLVPNMQYTCISARAIADIQAAGGDAFSDFYESPHGLDMERYENDLENKVQIISLQASSGIVVTVPSTFIASYPGTGGVPYRKTAIALKFGSIPKSFNLSLLIQSVIDEALDKCGLEAKASVVITGSDELKSQDAHLAWDTTRQQRMTVTNTDRSRYLAEKARADAQAQRILELEAALKARM